MDAAASGEDQSNSENRPVAKKVGWQIDEGAQKVWRFF
jgi:hypothetical protein